MEYEQSKYNIEINSQYGVVVYNTYTGALTVLDKNIECFIKEKENIEELLRQGFIVNKCLDEFNKLRFEHLSAIYSKKSDKLHVEISPTTKCQAKCWYCFENNVAKKTTLKDEDIEQIGTFISKKIEETGCKELSIMFFGGEPTIAISTLLKIGSLIQRVCDEHGIVWHSDMISNGILLSHKNTALLVEQIRLKHVQITLDGLKETYNKNKGINVFDKVIDNIVDIAGIINISIRLNISKNNLEEIEKLIEYLLFDKKLNGKVRIYLARVDDNDSNDKLGECIEHDYFYEFKYNMYKKFIPRSKSLKKEDLLPQVKRVFCGYESCQQLMIGPEGELYKCQRHLGQEEKRVGNIWTGELYSNDNVYTDIVILSKCEKCELLPICYGGCPNEKMKGKEELNCNLRRDEIRRFILLYVELIM